MLQKLLTSENFTSLQDSSQQQKALESSESMRAMMAEAKASQLQIEVRFSPFFTLLSSKEIFSRSALTRSKSCDESPI